MQTLGIVLRYELMILLLVLVALIAHKMLTRQINTDGLLLDKTGTARAISPARVQMLVVTLIIAIYYMFQVMKAEDTKRLPDLPTEMMIALGGSHVIYLGSKLFGMLAARFGFVSPRLMNLAKLKERRRKP